MEKARFYKNAVPTGLKMLRVQYARTRQKRMSKVLNQSRIKPSTRRWDSSETINAKNFTHLYLENNLTNLGLNVIMIRQG